MTLALLFIFSHGAFLVIGYKYLETTERESKKRSGYYHATAFYMHGRN